MFSVFPSTAWTNDLLRHQTLYVGFSFSWPVNRLCGILFNRHYRLEIHSLMICIFDPARELLPPWTNVYCCPSTVPSIWPPPFPMYSLYRQCATVGWGGVEMHCRPYSAGVLHSVSDQIQNLQNCFMTPNKMTSKDNIKGFVSLKFLRPWSTVHRQRGFHFRRPNWVPPPPRQAVLLLPPSGQGCGSGSRSLLDPDSIR